VTSYKLVSSILVSPHVLEVVATINGVVTAAFGGILFDSFYRNRGSNYITIPSRSTIVNTLIG